MQTERRIGFLMLCCVAMSACVDIQGPMPEPLAPSEVIADLRITSRAVMMAVGDTVQLTTQATAMDESAIPVDPRAVRWKSLDSVQVYVDTLGRVIGRKPSSVPVSVIASYRVALTTKSDTIPVYVTVGSIDASKLTLVAVDSTRVGAGSAMGRPRVRADLYRGNTLVSKGSFIPISVPAPVTISYSAIGGNDGEPVYMLNNDKSRLGKFWVRASVNLYGTEVSDSIEFTGIYPALIEIAFWLTDMPDGSIGNFGTVATKFNLQPCGVLQVRMLSAVLVDMVFSDSLAESSACGPIPQSVLTSIETNAYVPMFGNFVGANINGFPSFTIALRRSNTEGEIIYFLRETATQKRLNVSGTYINTTLNPL